MEWPEDMDLASFFGQDPCQWIALEGMRQVNAGHAGSCRFSQAYQHVEHLGAKVATSAHVLA